MPHGRKDIRASLEAEPSRVARLISFCAPIVLLGRPLKSSEMRDVNPPRSLIVVLSLLFLVLWTPLAAAQLVDSTSFEGNWGGFTPRGPSEQSDYVNPSLVTKIAHTGSYSVESSAFDGQQSFISKWYGGQAAVRVPFQATIWVFVRIQAGGHLEFAQLWGFTEETQFSGGTGYWLVSLLRSADGYAMIRTSREIKSSYFVSTQAWHKYSIAYDGRTLSLSVDDTHVLNDESAAGQKAIGAVILGVTSNANSKAGTKAPDIGYGTVYYDDYSLERVTVVSQLAQLMLIASAIIVAVVVAGVLFVYRKSRAKKAGAEAKQVVPSFPAVRNVKSCVRCKAELPLDAKFCDNCGASQASKS